MGTVGLYLAGPPGLLAGALSLGYEITDRLMSVDSDSMGEKLSKMLLPKYVASIYDL
jgi:hypothetical protein